MLLKFNRRLCSFLLAITASLSSLFGYSVDNGYFQSLFDNEGFSMKKLQSVSSDIEARVNAKEIPGAAVLIAKNGKIIYSDCVGYADYENSDEITADSMFRLASMSKPITAVAALKCSEIGLFNISDPISKYIPCLGNMKVAVFDNDNNIIGSVASERDITIFDILTHTSGLATGVSSGSIDFYPQDGDKLSDIIPKLSGTLLEFQPGSRSEYSAIFAFDTLGYIIELVSGMEYCDFLSKYIFEPLGMTDTTFNPTTEQVGRVVKLYGSIDGNLIEQQASSCCIGKYPTAYYGGAGGLISTVTDYYKFASMLLNNGELNGVRVLSEESAALMRTAQLSAELDGVDSTTNWGLGVRVITGCRNTIPKNSYGWSGAYGTHFWIDPDNGLVAIYMMNCTTTGGAGAPTANEFEKNVMNAMVF